MTGYEDPVELARRLKLGREEFLQRLITSLVVGGAYPRWNSRNRPSTAGAEFLRRLHELSFPGAPWSAPEVFVDELDLPARHPDEKGGAPDWAVIWPDRLWVVELKTEAASHRPNQIPSYFELGAHHFRGTSIDITYLTPPLTKPGPAVPDGSRYGHLTWADIAPDLRAVWSSTRDPSAATVAATLRVIDGLDGPARDWRDAFLVGENATTLRQLDAPIGDLTGSETVDRSDDATDMMLVARLTADDRRQRVVPNDASSLEELQALRLALRTRIAAAPSDDPVRHVVPWLWNAGTSTGRALSPTGEEHGFEVRVSRYRAEQYL